MKSFPLKNPVTVFLLCFISFSSLAQRRTGGDKLRMTVEEGENLILASKVKPQTAFTLAEKESQAGNRGIVTTFLIAKGIEGIQTMIANRRKRYTTNYTFAVKDESFYDQVSVLGPFDPTGIRFKGFKIVRLVGNNEGRQDTAFVAKFVIDTSDERINEIMNNSVFRMRLDSFQLKSAKVKMPRKTRRLNLDFEINFISSFISDNGQINADVSLGKLIFTVRDAPVDADDPAYEKYYQKLEREKPLCSGQVFLVPRSAGYYKEEETGFIEKCYGQGLYSIKVAVKESSKSNFVDKIILYNTDDVLSLGGQALQKKFGNSTSTGTRRATTTSQKSGKQ